MILEGEDNVNETFLAKIKERDGDNPIPAILPMVSFERISYDKWKSLLLNDQYLEQFARLVTEECVFVFLLLPADYIRLNFISFREYSGIFLDFGPMAYETIPKEEMKNDLIDKYMIAFADFLWNVANFLHKNDLLFYVSGAVCLVPSIFVYHAPFVRYSHQCL